MIDWTYLTNVFSAQLVFLAGYYLLLDRLPMGRFKRVYLLVTLLVSFAIPVLPLHPAAAAEPLLNAMPKAAEPVTGQAVALAPQADQPSGSSTDWIPALLWTIYLTGVLVSTLRIFAFLCGVGSRLRRGTRLARRGYTEVVLDDATPPHTFMRWVFYGREAAVAPAVLLHEAVHARQLHSVDRLLVAGLRIAFWWNPLLLLYERAVAANHELLADRGVLDGGYAVPEYQYSLLNALRPNTPTPYLASPAGFTITKKRFAMMNTSRPSRLRRILHIGIVTVLAGSAALLFGGSAEAAATEMSITPVPESTFVSIPDGTTAIASDTVPVPPPIPDYWEQIKPAQPNPPSPATLADWSDPSKYGVWVDGERVANQELENYSAEDFAHYFQSGLEKNAKDYGKYLYHIDVYTVDHFKKYNKIFPDGTFEPRGRDTGLNLPDFDKRLLRLAGANPGGGAGEGC